MHTWRSTATVDPAMYLLSSTICDEFSRFDYMLQVNWKPTAWENLLSGHEDVYMHAACRLAFTKKRSAADADSSGSGAQVSEYC